LPVDKVSLINGLGKCLTLKKAEDFGSYEPAEAVVVEAVNLDCTPTISISYESCGHI